MLDGEKLLKEYTGCIERYNVCSNKGTKEKVRQILEELSVYAEVYATNQETVEQLRDKIFNAETIEDYTGVRKLIEEAVEQYKISFQDFGRLMSVVGFCAGMAYKKDLQDVLECVSEIDPSLCQSVIGALQ